MMTPFYTIKQIIFVYFEKLARYLQYKLVSQTYMKN